MRPKSLFTAVVLTLIASALAGCVGDDANVPVDPPAASADCSTHDDGCVPLETATEDGRDLRKELTQDDEVPAPKWKLGDVFEVHFYFGSADTTGEHIKTMVVEDTGAEWVLATTSQDAAKDEATWDYPVLGGIGQESLETSGFGVTWDWMYQFPLSDGQTWQQEVQFINFNTFNFETHDATFEVSYAANIDTPHGDYPGMVIVATTEAGKLIEYNYVPHIGWFSHLWVYDQTTDDPEDVFFHAMSMGVSHGYTGPYYRNDGKELYNSALANVPIALASGTVPPMAVPPTATFTVDEGATYVRGIMFAWAVTGSSVLRMDLPDGTDITIQADHHDVNPDGGFALSFQFLDESAQPGEHRLTNAGAGLVWGGGGTIIQVTEAQYELTEADLAT